eukprot:scaffold4145_cov115-Isochrysis_galbana.AAC.24
MGLLFARPALIPPPPPPPCADAHTEKAYSTGDLFLTEWKRASPRCCMLYFRVLGLGLVRPIPLPPRARSEGEGDGGWGRGNGLGRGGDDRILFAS